MLLQLNIQNYAIIDEITIDFTGHFNVITGETGAGKSILMGALGLILGDRADSTVLLQPEKKCFVEAKFSYSNEKGLNDFFATNEFDKAEEITVRREIAPSGKSRAFINDTPANLSQLKQLGSLLADLHQQFDTLELGDTDFQREVLDALAENGSWLLQMQKSFSDYYIQKQNLEKLKAEQEHANKELDYNRFLFNELEELSLKENELEDIDAELKVLANAETIKSQLSTVFFELKESNEPVVQKLKSLQQKLSDLSKFQAHLDELSKRISSVQIELDDIAGEIESANDAIHYDAERITELNDRLNAGYKLLKKHSVNSTAELLDVKDQLSGKLVAITNLTAEIDKAEKNVDNLFAECKKTAGLISANRKKQVKPFVAEVNKLLVQVGMPNAKIDVSITEANLSATGADEINFLFDANNSGRFEKLSKVASGGELSRLMLIIKSLVASKVDLPTMIFDEIDTGISGEAARQVANIMKELAASYQLIVISHQPQIAARADAHYFVYKEDKKGRINTSIKLLSKDERIMSVAQMLGGDNPTEAALRNAKEMVSV